MLLLARTSGILPPTSLDKPWQFGRPEFWDASLMPSAGELQNLPQQPLPEPPTLVR